MNETGARSVGQMMTGQNRSYSQINVFHSYSAHQNSHIDWPDLIERVVSSDRPAPNCQASKQETESRLFEL
jgi:hypothetical protein